MQGEHDDQVMSMGYSVLSQKITYSWPWIQLILSIVAVLVIRFLVIHYFGWKWWLGLAAVIVIGFVFGVFILSLRRSRII